MPEKYVMAERFVLTENVNVLNTRYYKMGFVNVTAVIQTDVVGNVLAHVLKVQSSIVKKNHADV